MLLGGMGTVDAKELLTGAKIFEATYALYCGLAFVAVIGIMIAPFVNRVTRKLDAIHGLHHHHVGGSGNQRRVSITTPGTTVASTQNQASRGIFGSAIHCPQLIRSIQLGISLAAWRPSNRSKNKTGSVGKRIDLRFPLYARSESRFPADL
jgi:hypothetical protein